MCDKVGFTGGLHRRALATQVRARHDRAVSGFPKGALSPVLAVLAALSGFVVHPVASAAEPEPTPPTDTARLAAQDRVIDIEFRSASVQHAFRQLAAVGKVNIVVASDIKGRVNLKLKKVRWSDALKVVARSRGLGILRQGEIIYIDRLDRLAAYDAARVRAQVNAEATRPLVTRVYTLSYARAADLAPIVQSMLSERGRVVIEDRTNSLIVTDVAARLDTVARTVAR